MNEMNTSAANIPEQLKSNLHYYNLNNQLKYDLEVQNVIKNQQLEAIKLIQVSLEKLTATTTVPLHNQTTRAAKNTSNAPTILVYKETSLHKNLLVSKILNKAKYFYYQSIVQTMRLSLMSKLNYYSSLIQQLYPNGTSKVNTVGDLTRKNSDETNLVDEMKSLMQQILNDTYQFNSLNNTINCTEQITTTPPNFNVTSEAVNDNVLKECSASDLNKPSEKKSEKNEQQHSCPEQDDRIKKLHDVKHSLYSLLFSQTTSTPAESNENVSKRKHNEIDGATNKNTANKRRNKTAKVDDNNNQIVNDEKNVIHSRLPLPDNNNKTSSSKHHSQSKQHISTKLLKMSLKKATEPEVFTSQSNKIFTNEPESFINLEVLV